MKQRHAMRPLIVATAVMALTTCVVLGCSGSYQPKSSKENRAEGEAIKRRLQELPQVISVDGGYSRHLTDSGSAQYDVGVRDGTDMDAVAEKVVEEVWRSKLDPLSAITVFVAIQSDPADHVGRSVILRSAKDELTRRYGPRP
jgi:hypothetical protein